jgi:hypothetical protein
MTVHRELTLGDNNRLISAPIAELTKLRTSTHDFGPLTMGPNEAKVLAEDVESGDATIRRLVVHRLGSIWESEHQDGPRDLLSSGGQ